MSERFGIWRKVDEGDMNFWIDTFYRLHPCVEVVSVNGYPCGYPNGSEICLVIVYKEAV